MMIGQGQVRMMVWLLLSILDSVSSMEQQWIRNPYFDNFASTRGYKVRARSRLHCSKSCSSDSSCISFFFIPDQYLNCHLHNTTLTSGDSLYSTPNSVYYILNGAAPITTHPVTSSPGTTVPVITDPVTTTPVTTHPVTSSPVTTVPVTTDPVTTTPVTTHPVTSSPVTTVPVTTVPVTTAPVTTHPVTSSPVTTAPVTTSPDSNDSVITAPVTTSDVTTSPVTTAPVTTTPVKSDPSTTSPITSTPVTVASVKVPPVATTATSLDAAKSALEKNEYATTAPLFTCPPDDSIFRTVKLSDGNNFTYRVIKAQQNQSAASTSCGNLGGFLARVTTEAEMDFLLLLVNCTGYESQSYYVDGSTNDDTSFPFDVWTMSTGEPVPMSKHFWCDNCPDSFYSKQCLRMYVAQNHKWNDCSCSDTYHYICEK